MPSRIYRHAHKWRRHLSRSRAASWLLGTPRPAVEAPGKGLILIQIDGLPRNELEKAIRKGRMPFMRKLALRGDHEMKDFYPGLPSATPAVQGEIHFGIRTAVPSFSYYDREAGLERRMFNPESAKAVAERLSSQCPHPLLEEGSSYANIYAGGAQCARFCAERLDLPSLSKDTSLTKVIVLLFLYLPRFIRMAALGLVELYLALIDFVRGLFAREDFFKELKFIPTRLGICIVLRELVEFMIRLDIQEGVPIIHANFLGYDEQAHRRGPDSRFAHWTLGGIDKVVRNITRAAARTEARDYEIVIFSDHGQERTQPFRGPGGEKVDAVARQALEVMNHALSVSPHTSSGAGKLYSRGRSLLRRGAVPPNQVHGPEQVVVTAMGPVAQLYFPQNVDVEALKAATARLLAREGGVPGVLYTQGDDDVICETPLATLTLPEDASRFLGQHHPFKKAVIEDLIALCRHPDAGDLVLSGWRPEGRPFTFAEENGSHGGVGPQETRGFILAPRGFLQPGQLSGAVRGEDLHHSAKKYLGRAAAPRLATHRDFREPIRVMTYNIHSCIGMDGRLRPERIARVIKGASADVIALQEVDVGRGRSRGEHQAALIAGYLKMHWHFFSLLESEDHNEQYGLALLSRFPLEILKEGSLTNAHPHKRREARGAIWARLEDHRGRPMHVVNTHFGLALEERRRQADVLLGPEWLAEIPDDESLIVCGDFNSTPRSKVYARMTATLRDAQRVARTPANFRTFTSASPVLRIDHIFVNRAVNVSDISRPRTPRAVLASDHLPLCADCLCTAPDEASLLNSNTLNTDAPTSLAAL